MGFFDFLFGKKEEPFVLNVDKGVFQAVVEATIHFSNKNKQPVRRTDCKPSARLAIDLGLDALSLAEITMCLEESYEIEFADDAMDDGQLNLDQLAKLVSIETGESYETKNHKRPETKDFGKEPKNILKCHLCKKESQYEIEYKKSKCVFCNAPFLNAGLLPEPLHSLPFGSALQELDTPDIKEVPLAYLPEWVCSWCALPYCGGDNCPVCGCQYQNCPPCNLHARLAGADNHLIGNFYAQSFMMGNSAVCRMGRMSHENVEAMGGTKKVMEMMLNQKPPKGVKY